MPLYGDGIFGRNPNPGHEVVIVDMDSAKIVGSIDTSPYRAPHGIQIGPDGTIYVASDLDRKLLVIDPKARKVTKAIDTDGTTHWIGILPNGSKIYATNKNDPFVTVVNLKTGTVATKIEVPGGTEGIAVSPDGKRIIVMTHTAPGLAVDRPRHGHDRRSHRDPESERRRRVQGVLQPRRQAAPDDESRLDR